MHLTKTSPYCDGFGPITFFCFFSKCELVLRFPSSRTTNINLQALAWLKQISKLWHDWDESISSPNVKPTLYLSLQLSQSLHCFLSKHEGQECFCCSYPHYLMMVPNLNLYTQKFLILPPCLAFTISFHLSHLQHKEPNILLLAKVHMSKLSQELSQITHKESLHTLHAREKFSRNKFFHNTKHKILNEIGLILGLGVKIYFNLRYFLFMQSHVTFFLCHQFHKNWGFSSYHTYFMDNFIQQ